MTWTLAQIKEHNERIARAEAEARRALSHAVPEHKPAPALVPEEKRSAPRPWKITVRFVGRRTRLLDPDNFAGSCKSLLDGLQRAGLIPDDSPGCIILQTEQEKVAHVRHEETIITIEYP